MKNSTSPLRRVASLANWVLPRHSGLFDLEFDPYPSLRMAFAPAMVDIYSIVVSVAQVIAYGYFFYSLLSLPEAICAGIGPALLSVLPAMLAVQFLWAMKAVYFFDKASEDAGGFFFGLYRIIRTTLLLLPFSFAPSWVIGCLAWPFLRIRASGGFHFYDQSLLIGQYVQNSLWFVGANCGSLRENFHTFSRLTVENRSRYWDAASEAMVANLVMMILWGIAFLLIYFLGFNDGGSVSVMGRIIPNMTAIAAIYLTIVGACMSVTNSCAMAAISILEFRRQTHQARSEDALPLDDRQQWRSFIPHALAGVVVYGVLLRVVLVALGNVDCSLR